MKQRLIMLSLVMMTMVGSVQGQGFLKKLGNAVDKLSKETEKVTKSNDSKKSSAKAETEATPQKTSSNKEKEETYGYPPDNDEDGPFKYPAGNRSTLFKISEKDLSELSTFKKTASTKVINVDNMDDINLGFLIDDRVFAVLSRSSSFCLDGKGNIIKQWPKNIMTSCQAIGEEFPHFDSGRFICQTDESGKKTENAYIYDKNFKLVKMIPKVSQFTLFKDGVALVYTKEKPTSGFMMVDKARFIDVNGNPIFQSLSTQLNKDLEHAPMHTDRGFKSRPMCEGLTATYMSKKYTSCTWGFRDAKGNMVIPAKYVDVQDFSNGLAAVCMDVSGVKKWGYIDTKGNMVIEPKFTYMPSPFDKCGLAMVTDKEKNLMFINRQGQVVSEKYDNITAFCNGRAIWTTPHKRQEKILSCDMMIDNNFKTVSLIGDKTTFVANGTPGLDSDNVRWYFQNDSYAPHGVSGRIVFANDQIYVKTKSKYLERDHGLGLLDQNGNVVIAGLAGPFVNGLAPVIQQDNLGKYTGVGYVNMQGEWVVKFELNEF